MDVIGTGTTGGYLACGDLVLLADDRQWSRRNIVPVIHDGCGERYGRAWPARSMRCRRG